MATKAAIQQEHQWPKRYHIPGKGWRHYVKQEHITKHLANKLQNHINGITIQDHWAKRKCYGRGHSTMAEWDLAEKAIQSLPVGQRKWNSKTAANFLPHSTNMKWWELWMEDKCPRCKQEGENKEHLNRCQHPSANKTWTTALEKLDNWLQANNTAHNSNKRSSTGWQHGNRINQTISQAIHHKLLRNRTY